MVLSKPAQSEAFTSHICSDRQLSIWQQELTLMRTFWEKDYQKSPEGLLRGQPLAIAEQWLQQHPQAVEDLNRQFIQLSLQVAQTEVEQQRSHWQAHVELVCAHAKQRFSAGEELMALQDMVTLGQKLPSREALNTPLNQMRVIATLQAVLGDIRERRHLKHTDDLTRMVLSQDGKMVAAIGKDHVIRLWDTTDGKDLATITNNGENIRAISLSPDNQLLAFTSEDSTLQFWDIAQGRICGRYELGRPDFDHLVFATDSQRLAVSTSRARTFYLWQRDAASLIQSVNNTAIDSLYFSPDSQLLVTRTYDRCIKLWHTRDGQELTTLIQNAEYATSFSPDGQLLAIANLDRTVALWQIGLSLLTLKPIHLTTLECHQGPVTRLLFSPDGTMLVSQGRDHTIKLWDLATHRLKGTLVGLQGDYADLQFSPDGQKLLATRHHSQLQYWNLERLEQRHSSDKWLEPTQWRPQKPGHWNLHFNADSTLSTLACLNQQRLELWAFTTQPALTLDDKDDRPTGLAVSADGQLIALGDNQKAVHVWRRNGTKFMTLKGHERAVHAVCFGPNQTLASASQDGIIKLWDVKSGHELTTIQGHSGPITRLAFHLEGDILASAGENGIVKLWGIDFSVLASQGIEIGSLSVAEQGVACLAFVGDVLVTGDNTGQLQFWEAGMLQRSILAHTDAITHLAMNANGTQLLTASYDHTIKIWSPTGQAIRTIRAHRGPVKTVAWHPNGRLLASASADGTTKLLMQDGQEVATLHTCRCCCCPEIYVLNSNGTTEARESQKSTRRTSQLTTLAFTPDGKNLVDAFSCGRPRLWNLDLDTLLSQGKHWLQQ